MSELSAKRETSAKKTPTLPPEEKDDKSPSVDNEYASSEDFPINENNGKDENIEGGEEEKQIVETQKESPSSNGTGGETSETKEKASENVAISDTVPSIEHLHYGDEGSCYICHAVSGNFFYFGNCGHRLCIVHTIHYFCGEVKPSTCVCGRSFIVKNETKHPPLHTGTDRETNRAWEKYIDYIIREQEEKGRTGSPGINVKGSGIREKVISGVSKFIGKMDAETKEIEVTDIPIKEENLPILLTKRVSARKMREIGQIGIGTLVLNNITLSRLLEHNYGIDSLKDFGLRDWDQLRKLGITSVHLKYYRTTLLPVSKLKEATSMTKQNLIDLVDNVGELASTGITSDELLLFDFTITDFRTLGINTNHFSLFGYSFPEWKRFGFTLEILDRDFHLKNISAFTACGPWIATDEVEYYYLKKKGIITNPRYGRIKSKQVRPQTKYKKKTRIIPSSMDYGRRVTKKKYNSRTQTRRKEAEKKKKTEIVL